MASNNAWSTGPFLTEHWNGSSWSQVTVPGQDNILTNLTAISTTDIWALGREYINTNNTYLTLAEHWGESQWSVDSTPNPSATFNALYGGAAVSGNDVWAVGTYADGSSSLQTLAEHWNGSYWSIVVTRRVRFVTTAIKRGSQIPEVC